WFDPPKARQAAHSMIDQGVDILYAERLNAVQAAQERGKLAIGNVVDARHHYPDTVVVSALWDAEPTIVRALTMVRRGTFKADDYGMHSQMRYQGSMLSSLGAFADKLPGGLVASVESRRKTILEDTSTTKTNATRPQSPAP